MLKSESSAADCVVADMKIYADDTIRTKLPNVIDGLKIIARRILYCFHTTKKKPNEVIKEATLTGRVMEFHPHGDASISDAISNLCQPFTHIIPLIFSESNIGTYVGDESAAARYVDVAESEVAKDLFFGDLNKNMLRMVPRETGVDVEPANFIPRLPTSLIVPAFGIAIGYKTDTVGCSVPELCKLTKEYILLRNSSIDWDRKLKSLVKYMLPDFPTYSILRNSEELLRNYKNGLWDTPIVTDGIMKIKHDQIIVETLPPGKSFGTITMAVGQTTKTPGSFEAQNFQQMEDFSGKKQGVMRGQFTCIVRRGINPFDVLAQLKKRLQFSGGWKPERRYVEHQGGDNYAMTNETPFSLLDKWYKVRYAAVLGDLKQTLKNMVNDQRRLMALIVVVDHTDDVYKIFKNAKTAADTIAPLCKRFNLTRMQAEYLASLRFSDITAHGKDELLQHLEKIKADIKALQSKFGHIDQLMIESIEKFENKYDKQFERWCVVPKYIGYACYKGNGWIMLEDEAEMDSVLKDFPDIETIEFGLFKKGAEIRPFGSDEDIEGDPPKYFKSASVHNLLGEKNTVFVLKGGAMVLNGLLPKFTGMTQAVPVGDAFTVIYRNGMIEHQKVTEKITRKNKDAGPTMKDAVYVSNTTGKDLIVVHGNSTAQNVLTVERVQPGQKLHRIVVGEWRVLACFDPSEQKTVYVNVPKELRNRCIVRHICLPNLADLVKPGEKKVVAFGRTGAKADFMVKLIRRKSTIMTLDV